MNDIAYSCPFVPAEWIAAHGFRPSRLVPRGSCDEAVVGAREGICPYVRAFITELAAAPRAAIIVTTTCDQMRRAAEPLADRIGSPVFLMHVPAAWQHANAHRTYADELRRLGRFLERIGGHNPSPEALAEVMLTFDDRRRKPDRQFPPKQGGTPLAIVGGPMTRDDVELVRRIEEAGGRIALDATDTGRRCLPARFDRRALRDDPFGELVAAYFGHIPAVFQRPNHMLYQWLQRELDDSGVKGILFHRYTWCDTWLAELPRLREWTDLPVLEIEATDDPTSSQSRTLYRVQAFLETLA